MGKIGGKVLVPKGWLMKVREIAEKEIGGNVFAPKGRLIKARGTAPGKKPEKTPQP
jgi:hypothetical protein